MTNPTTDLDAYTDQELEQALARVLAHARSFWQGRQTRECSAQDQSGGAGGNDRHNPLAGQLFHQPVQEIGIHPLQRQSAGPQLAAQRRSARLAVLSCAERWYGRGFRRKGKWSIHSRV